MKMNIIYKICGIPDTICHFSAFSHNGPKKNTYEGTIDQELAEAGVQAPGGRFMFTHKLSLAYTPISRAKSRPEFEKQPAIGLITTL